MIPAWNENATGTTIQCAEEDGKVATASTATTPPDVSPVHTLNLHLGTPPCTAPSSEGRRATADVIQKWVAVENAALARDNALNARFAARDALESLILRTREEVRVACPGHAVDTAAIDEYLASLESYMESNCMDADAAAIRQTFADASRMILERCPALVGHRAALDAEAERKDAEMRQRAQEADGDRELKSDPQRLRAAPQRREQGASLFKEEQYEAAQRRFVQALAILGELYDTTSPENKQTKDAIALSCHLNIASCSCKLGYWKNAVNNCTSALELHPDHPKALFRRGQARIELAELDDAVKDLQQAAALSGGDVAVQAALDTALQRSVALATKERTMFSKMFR